MQAGRGRNWESSMRPPYVRYVPDANRRQRQLLGSQILRGNTLTQPYLHSDRHGLDHAGNIGVLGHTVKAEVALCEQRLEF
jgi:hypothetical protein